MQAEASAIFGSLFGAERLESEERGGRHVGKVIEEPRAARRELSVFWGGSVKQQFGNKMAGALEVNT